MSETESPAVLITGQSREFVKKEPLTDMEMGKLISAVGNLESKAITLGLMEPGHVYSQYDIQKRIPAAQNGPSGWHEKSSAFWNYCVHSFSPIALVAKEALNSDLTTFGYEKTPKGEVLGDALAGLLLDFSLKYPEFSLQDFFGSTSSAGVKKESEEGEYKNRAPITRYKILWDLVTSKLPVRSSDIEANLGEEATHTGGHLEELARRGVIQYESIDHGKPITKYKYKDNDLPQDPPHHSSKRLMEYTIKLLRQNPHGEHKLSDFADAYIKDEGKELSPEQTANLRRHFSSELAHLERDGYVEKGKFGDENKSEITMSERQIDAVFELVTILDRFKLQDFDALAFGRTRLKEILSNPQQVTELMKKAKEHSSHSLTPREESMGKILDIVNSLSEPTLNSIQAELRSRGINLSKPGVNNILRVLADDGQIAFNVVNGVRHYNQNIS